MKLGDFEFAHPWWLAGLAVLPLLAWFLGGRGPVPAVRFSSLAPLRAVAGKRRAAWGGMSRLLALLAVGAFLVGLARPRLGKAHDIIESSGVDIVLVLDVSPSMRAEDFTLGGQRVNRLDAVKDVTRRFIEGRPNDRIGIVAFARAPFVVSAITLNHDWLLKNLERIAIGMLGDGTSIGGAIASASNRLKDNPSKSKVVILLTDGAETVTTIKPSIAAEAAKAVGIRIHTIAAGTDQPASIGSGIPFLRPMTRGSDLDEASLREIAEIGNGKFFRATDSDSLNKVFEEIDRLEKTEVKLKKFTEWRELFPWFAAAGALLLAMQLIHSATAGRSLP